MDNLIIFLAKYLIFLMVLGLLVTWFFSHSKIRWQFAATIVVSGLIALALSRAASRLYYSPRPFSLDNVQPLVEQAINNGFPSDHALLTGTLAATTYIYNRRVGKIMLVLALLVGLGRIGARVHAPIDVIASFVISIFAAWVAYQIVKKLAYRYHLPKDE